MNKYEVAVVISSTLTDEERLAVLEQVKGYIAKYELSEEGAKKTMKLYLKYGADKNEKIISGLKRISKPGLRIYADNEHLPKVLGGLGIAVISTSQGVMTDKKARKLGIGGEVLAYIW